MSRLYTYPEQDLLRLAKRVNNPKRSYLLVNPLQGKHIPAAPDKAIDMMRALGRAVNKMQTGKALIIGFAETATAIGAVAATELGQDCIYLQTTREADESVGRWIRFSEEHSHATEQKLCGDNLEEYISICDYILLVDDEISTGNTILNIVSAIRKNFPAAVNKDFVTASIINRVDNSALSEFYRRKISFLYLLHPEEGSYEEQVQAFSVGEALYPKNEENKSRPVVCHLTKTIPPPHRGVATGEYNRACDGLITEIEQKLSFVNNERVLVLGTEEFMYPALLLAYRIQKTGKAGSVRFHATTRSPVGISEEHGYPITNGIKLHSMYSEERVSYLYNIEAYDTVIVFSDAPVTSMTAAAELQRGLEEKHCSRVQFFYVTHDV